MVGHTDANGLAGLFNREAHHEACSSAAPCGCPGMRCQVNVILLLGQNLPVFSNKLDVDMGGNGQVVAQKVLHMS